MFSKMFVAIGSPCRRAAGVRSTASSITPAPDGARLVWVRKRQKKVGIGDPHKHVVTDYMFAGPGFATRKLVGWGLPQTPSPKGGGN